MSTTLFPNPKETALLVLIVEDANRLHQPSGYQVDVRPCDRETTDGDWTTGPFWNNKRTATAVFGTLDEALHGAVERIQVNGVLWERTDPLTGETRYNYARPGERRSGMIVARRTREGTWVRTSD